VWWSVLLSGDDTDDAVLPTKDQVDKAFSLGRQSFEKKFENVFHVFDSKYKYSDDEQSFAKAVLSNLVGGVGHFYGNYNLLIIV